jgi:hypothetical protein
VTGSANDEIQLPILNSHKLAALPFQGISIMKQISTDFWTENPWVKNSPDSLLKTLGMTKISPIGGMSRSRGGGTLLLINSGYSGLFLYRHDFSSPTTTHWMLLESIVRRKTDALVRAYWWHFQRVPRLMVVSRRYLFVSTVRERDRKHAVVEVCVLNNS